MTALATAAPEATLSTQDGCAPVAEVDGESWGGWWPGGLGLEVPELHMYNLSPLLHLCHCYLKLFFGTPAMHAMFAGPPMTMTVSDDIKSPNTVCGKQVERFITGGHT
jgi:hypothetical protein